MYLFLGNIPFGVVLKETTKETCHAGGCDSNFETWSRARTGGEALYEHRLRPVLGDPQGPDAPRFRFWTRPALGGLKFPKWGNKRWSFLSPDRSSGSIGSGCFLLRQTRGAVKRQQVDSPEIWRGTLFGCSPHLTR